MDKKQHVNVVLTDTVCKGVAKFVVMLQSNFDLHDPATEWSVTIRNRSDTTINTIKTLASNISQMNNKNVYEMSYFNDEWTRAKTIVEVYKILPTSVLCEDIVICTDLVMSNENRIKASHRTIHNVYGLWDDPTPFPCS